MVIATFIAIIIAYLFGSISSAILISNLMGLPDPRTYGSQNPGATNVLRQGGKEAAILTLAGDTLKGVIPVLLAKWYGFNTIELSLVALAAFLGHLYPIFFQFQGGKGVATAWGCFTALAWPVGIFLILTWLLTSIIFRYSSLSSLICAILGPIYMAYFTNLNYTLMALIVSILLIFRHKKNIQNLLQGKESKIGQK